MTYREGKESTVTHQGHEYLVDDILDIAEKKSDVKVSIDKLDWILEHTQVDSDRVKKADVTIPIVVLFDKKDYIVLDGAHRLTKAKKLGLKFVICKVLVSSEMPKPIN